MFGPYSTIRELARLSLALLDVDFVWPHRPVADGRNAAQKKKIADSITNISSDLCNLLFPIPCPHRTQHHFTFSRSCPCQGWRKLRAHCAWLSKGLLAKDKQQLSPCLKLVETHRSPRCNCKRFHRTALRFPLQPYQALTATEACLSESFGTQDSTLLLGASVIGCRRIPLSIIAKL